jgi:hypothetical protein
VKKEEDAAAAKRKEIFNGFPFFFDSAVDASILGVSSFPARTPAAVYHPSKLETNRISFSSRSN